MEVKSGVTNHAFLNIAEQGVFQVVPEIQEKFPKALVLKPNKTYAFRVAGVNSMGVGPWSEVASFKMITPGSPKAPINVKISERKCDEGGAAISWEISTGLYPILEFRVFLAINCENPPVTNGATTVSNLVHFHCIILTVFLYLIHVNFHLSFFFHFVNRPRILFSSRCTKEVRTGAM